MKTAILETYGDNRMFRPGQYVRQKSDDQEIEADKSIARPIDTSSNAYDLDYSNTSREGNDNVVIRFTDPGSDIEFEELLREQSRLGRKKVVEGLSHGENLQLQMVRWAIDRVENARMHGDIDRLSTLVSLHESLANEISRFAASMHIE